MHAYIHTYIHTYIEVCVCVCVYVCVCVCVCLCVYAARQVSTDAKVESFVKQHTSINYCPRPCDEEMIVHTVQSSTIVGRETALPEVRVVDTGWQGGGGDDREGGHAGGHAGAGAGGHPVAAYPSQHSHSKGRDGVGPANSSNSSNSLHVAQPAARNPDAHIHILETIFESERALSTIPTVGAPSSLRRGDGGEDTAARSVGARAPSRSHAGEASWEQNAAAAAAAALREQMVTPDGSIIAPWAQRWSGNVPHLNQPPAQYASYHQHLAQHGVPPGGIHDHALAAQSSLQERSLERRRDKEVQKLLEASREVGLRAAAAAQREAADVRLQAAEDARAVRLAAEQVLTPDAFPPVAACTAFTPGPRGSAHAVRRSMYVYYCYWKRLPRPCGPVDTEL